MIGWVTSAVMPSAMNPCWGLFSPSMQSWIQPLLQGAGLFPKIISLSFIPVEVKHGKAWQFSTPTTNLVHRELCHKDKQVSYII